MCYSCGYTPCACGNNNITTYTLQPMATLEGAAYEQGEFQPIWGHGLTPDDAGAVYSTRTGMYTRIGNMVWVYGRMILTTEPSGSGDICIGGLPFVVNDDDFSGNNAALIQCFVSNFTLAKAGVVVGRPTASTSQMVLGVQYTDGTNLSQLGNSADANNSQLTFSGWYMTE